MTENTEPKPDYEQQFAHRFSAADPEYQEYVRRPPDPPPIVEDWSGRRGNHRGRDNRHRGGGGGRGWYGHRGWGGNHRREPDGRGYESGHQSAQQGYDRGYHPYNQRHYQSY